MSRGTMPGAARSDARANGPSVAETLKPCPFCGLSELSVTGTDAMFAHPFGDGSCLLAGKTWPPGHFKKWNRRAASAQQISAPLPPVETIEKAICCSTGCVRKDDCWAHMSPLRTRQAKAVLAALAGAQPKDDSSS